MRVLVTGAAGFVGRHVRHALVAHGHDARTDVGAHRLSLDLADEGVADTVVRENEPEAVIHLAARVVPGDDPWRDLLRVNPLSTYRTLQATQRYVPRAHVLVASSSAVYGAVPRERNPVSETEATRPVTMYGASKASAEAVAFAFIGAGLHVTVCRPFNTVGPGGDKRSALAQWTRQLSELGATGRDGVFRCGPLNTFRDLTDVRDIARAYVAVLESGTREPVLNLCSGRAVEGAELLKLLFSAAHVEPQVVAASARTDDILYQCGDRSRLTRSTGWRPSILLEQTVQDVLREQRQSISV